MKKIFFSVLAIAAIAACSKSEVQYEQSGAISFAPIASNTTKSVAGYGDSGFDGVFPTGINLYVFANVQDEEDGQLKNSWTTPYFKNALFVWNDGKGVASEQVINGNSVKTPGAYIGDPTRYWPNVKSLKFAGYSDACNVSDLAVKPEMDFTTNILSIKGYTQDNTNKTYTQGGEVLTEEGANDLMWFPCDGNVYTKQTNEIVANMLHACSWITINVYGDNVTATNTSHTGWTLESLVVKGLAHTGDATCIAENKAVTWTIADNAVKEDELYYKGPTSFTTEGVEYAAVRNNFIVIPQTPTSLDVTYTFVSQEAVGTVGNSGYQPAITLTETKNIPLKYTGEGQPNTEWLSGVHYIYNVKITATEILIDPVVVEWTPGASTNVTI